MSIWRAYLALLLILPCAAQTALQGNDLRFRRQYAPGSKPNVILDGTRIARLQSGSYFSVVVDPGMHRLQSSLNPHREMTEIEELARQTVYVEMTFADVPHQAGAFSHGQWLKTPIFTATPDIARDRFPDLKPLDHKWTFDQRVQAIKPDFP